MTALQTAIYIVFICMEIFGVSFFMETYKKSIRKGKANIWEVRGIGLVLSFVAIGLLIGIKIFYPILGQLGAPLWADLILQSCVFFYLQMQTDMVIVKRLLKSFLPSLLAKTGLPEKEVEALMEAMLEKKEETPVLHS